MAKPENIKYGFKNMAGFIKAKKTNDLGREVELAEPEI